MSGSGPVLLVGGESEIGAATATHLVRLGYSVAATTRRREYVGESRPFLDLAMPLDHWNPPENTRAACVFAAVARLGDCAADPAGSAKVNVTGTVSLVERLAANDIPTLFLSTDKVFDGTRPHVPAGAPMTPVSEYGRQKAAAETTIRALAAAGARVATLRLAKVVSPGMPLLRRWVAALAAGEKVTAFHDMMMAPTPVGLVAATIERLLSDGASGIFQLTGPRDVSYSDVAGYLAQKLGADGGLVTPASAYSAGLPQGSTPPNTTLDSTGLRERFNIVAPDPWAIVDELVETCRS